ncbi:hypothetical protein NL676_024741 [Syzygium grande]|nr:hypothetical protein NL676_024741 [Syzygium grande]
MKVGAPTPTTFSPPIKSPRPPACLTSPLPSPLPLSLSLPLSLFRVRSPSRALFLAQAFPHVSSPEAPSHLLRSSPLLPASRPPDRRRRRRPPSAPSRPPVCDLRREPRPSLLAASAAAVSQLALTRWDEDAITVRRDLALEESIGLVSLSDAITVRGELAI